MSQQDTEWKIFPNFFAQSPSTLLLDDRDFEVRLASRPPNGENRVDGRGRSRSARSARLGKRLNPELKSWLDDVIVPALVREYLAEMRSQNRLATAGPLEVTSDKGR